MQQHALEIRRPPLGQGGGVKGESFRGIQKVNWVEFGDRGRTCVDVLGCQDQGQREEDRQEEGEVCDLGWLRGWKCCSERVQEEQLEDGESSVGPKSLKY